MLRALYILPLVLTWSIGATEAADQPPHAVPDLLAALRDIGQMSFCGEKVPMEYPEVRERFEKEFLLTLWDRPQVILWLKRSSRYFPAVEEMLKESAMPLDLKYLAVAESALLPHAGSRKGAVGFWQFMPATGRKYGLTINARVDQRRNLQASTRAAIRYLKDLHEQFGSWSLAVAAFNMGEEGLMAEILEQGVKDYFRLYLPQETQRFLFRILSVKLLVENPGTYGFHLSDQDYYLPLQSDRVRFDLMDETPVRVIGQAAGTNFKTIKDLNPEIRGHALAPGSYEILLPRGAGQGFEARLKEHLQAFLTARSQQAYIVKEGDNLSTIAQRFDIPLPSLLIWNRLDPKRPIRPGDRLVIYPPRPSNEGPETDGEARP
jgi:hypothetical protein